MFFKKVEGIARFERYLGARYQTLTYCFHKFIDSKGSIIVELGTSRSFVDGRRRGCMINDIKYWKPRKVKSWDWGAGLFTLMCPTALSEYHPEIHTVDISPEAIAISKVITSGYSHLIEYHCMSSHQFLSMFDKKADLIYMDAGDNDEASAQLHLEDAEIIVDRALLAPGGTILVDDFNIPGTSDSKGKFSVPFLCENGFEIKIEAYQAVLEKSASRH